MVLKLYYDLMSQPSRALYILLKAAKINFEALPVELRNGIQYGDEFKRINRFQKVPVIDHNGFFLSESVAIVKYLSAESFISESLFPKDNKKQARVNEYLAWQHIGIRAPCALFFIASIIDPYVTGKPVNIARVEARKKGMISALDLFEEKWLGLGSKFIAGDTLTVADIFGCCEIEQPRMAGYDPKIGRPNIAAWMERVKQELNPFYDEAHLIVNKIAKKFDLSSSDTLSKL